ncbi:carboxymuconolactone decarboxylase family protein [Streptomyces sp. FH025]|uniref:carboxymuconolactone decarboxylase family protein n=1 Tax=Streptomyces sp. FH025 TaxID=2815937 RepID=UPI001A9FCF5B|nr:carboxymuconolactone decarboxylase family protein [Streptomyces sp. FH025]MBO1418900.1 carboxymuconolactone decarboxylase family protein [Streptomyces sp. FH025]
MAEAERPLSLPARTVDDPDPAIAAVLTGVQAKTGAVPNMYARMANAPGLLQAYLGGIEAFRSGSGFTPAEQETVLLTISRANGCTYCVAAHSTLADRNDVPTEITDAIRDGRPIPDARLAALSAFTEAFVETRGLPTAAQTDDFLRAGFTETDILHILLAVSAKTISNYTNHLFHTPVDPAFARRAWQD